ncbi:hypothetical protein GCM10027075_67620 [Streptomyces heilongjiangensis]
MRPVSQWPPELKVEEVAGGAGEVAARLLTRTFDGDLWIGVGCEALPAGSHSAQLQRQPSAVPIPNYVTYGTR